MRMDHHGLMPNGVCRTCWTKPSPCVECLASICTCNISDHECDKCETNIPRWLAVVTGEVALVDPGRTRGHGGIQRCPECGGRGVVVAEGKRDSDGMHIVRMRCPARYRPCLAAGQEWIYESNTGTCPTCWSPVRPCEAMNDVNCEVLICACNLSTHDCDDSFEHSVYLYLFHERDSPSEDMDDWGRDGPLIGPLQVSWTYETLKIHDPSWEKDVIELPMEGDCIKFHGKYYGDCEVQTRPKRVPDLTFAEAAKLIRSDKPDARPLGAPGTQPRGGKEEFGWRTKKNRS